MGYCNKDFPLNIMELQLLWLRISALIHRINGDIKPEFYIVPPSEWEHLSWEHVIVGHLVNLSIVFIE